MYIVKQSRLRKSKLIPPCPSLQCETCSSHTRHIFWAIYSRDVSGKKFESPSSYAELVRVLLMFNMLENCFRKNCNFADMRIYPVNTLQISYEDHPGLYEGYKRMIDTYKTTNDEEQLDYKQLRVHSPHLNEEPLTCQRFLV